MMPQLAMLSAGKASLGMPAGNHELPAIEGLEALLQVSGLPADGFSAELQALLMQLSPQMLQRLEQLLAGGSELPQAARTILRELAAGQGAGEFPGMFRQLAAGETQAVSPLPVAAESAASAPVAKLAGNLPLAAADLASASHTALATVLAATTPGTPGMPGTQATTALPQQLASPLLAMGVPQVVGGREWPDAIGQRLLWMAQGDQQFARLKLNPPHLGPLEVRVSVQNDQASVTFIAQHASAREALEAALPRLREMLDQNALQLVRADVSDPGAGQRQQAEGSAGGTGTAWPGADAGVPGDADDAVGLGAPGGIAGNGLIDLFA